MGGAKIFKNLQTQLFLFFIICCNRSSEKEYELVDLTKENKDTPGKSKKLKQPRIAFAKINKQEYLETVRTAIVDETKKRKNSSDVDDEATVKSPKAKPKKCKTEIPASETDSKSKPEEDLKTTEAKNSIDADIKSVEQSPKAKSDKKNKTEASETDSKPIPEEN